MADGPGPTRGTGAGAGRRAEDPQGALGRLVSLEMGKILSEGLGEVQEMIDMCGAWLIGCPRQLYASRCIQNARGAVYEQSHPLGADEDDLVSSFPVPYRRRTRRSPPCAAP